MTKSFLPYKEADLVAWLANLNNVVATDAAAWSVPAQMGLDFATLFGDYESAYREATTPVTRTTMTVQLKNTLRKDTVRLARQIVNIVQDAPTTTDTMRRQIEVTVRDTSPTPIGPPTTAPFIEVRNVTGWTVKGRLKPTQGEGRGKPAGVKGATMLYFIGDTFPSDPSLWTTALVTTRTTFNLQFPASAGPGAMVWLTAYWSNPRLESGPAAPPINTRLQGEALTKVA